MAVLKALCLSALLLQVHASEKCVPGVKGPPCSEDSDCSIIPGCTRCAASNHCTGVPLPGPSPGPSPPGPHPHPHGKGGCDTNDKSWDFLLLVQGWPNSACVSKPCEGADFGKINHWTMHGLWPSRGGSRANSYPCECDQRQFDASKVASLQKDMDGQWPSMTGKNDQFWGHEWTKHGTCCASTPGLEHEVDFFGKTLSLHAAHDIGAALAKASITPSNSKTYAAAELMKALKSVSGFDPLMGCVNANGKQYLHEVSYCLDKTLKSSLCDSGIAHLQGDEVSDCDQSKPIILIEPASEEKLFTV